MPQRLPATLPGPLSARPAAVAQPALAGQLLPPGTAAAQPLLPARSLPARLQALPGPLLSPGV